jgi:hypothetical protein
VQAIELNFSRIQRTTAFANRSKQGSEYRIFGSDLSLTLMIAQCADKFICRVQRGNKRNNSNSSETPTNAARSATRATSPKPGTQGKDSSIHFKSMLHQKKLTNWFAESQHIAWTTNQTNFQKIHVNSTWHEQQLPSINFGNAYTRPPKYNPTRPTAAPL